MRRKLWIVLGTASLVLGLLGIVLPLLPTTPFLLLTAACYFRGSDKLYRKLMEHPVLGVYIRDFREYKAIPLRAKILSVSFLWVTIFYCVFGVTDVLWLRIVLLVVAVGVTWHILSYRTRKQTEKRERECGGCDV